MILGDAGETLPKHEVRAAMLEIHGNITKSSGKASVRCSQISPSYKETSSNGMLWWTKPQTRFAGG